MKMNKSASDLVLMACKNGVAIRRKSDHGSCPENPVLFTNMTELQEYLSAHFDAQTIHTIIEAEKL